MVVAVFVAMFMLMRMLVVMAMVMLVGMFVPVLMLMAMVVPMQMRRVRPAAGHVVAVLLHAVGQHGHVQAPHPAIFGGL